MSTFQGESRHKTEGRVIPREVSNSTTPLMTNDDKLTPILVPFTDGADRSMSELGASWKEGFRLLRDVEGFRFQ